MTVPSRFSKCRQLGNPEHPTKGRPPRFAKRLINGLPHNGQSLPIGSAIGFFDWKTPLALPSSSSSRSEGSSLSQGKGTSLDTNLQVGY